jgi:hypothetical protein
MPPADKAVYAGNCHSPLVSSPARRPKSVRTPAHQHDQLSAHQKWAAIGSRPQPSKFRFSWVPIARRAITGITTRGIVIIIVKIRSGPHINSHGTAHHLCGYSLLAY